MWKIKGEGIKWRQELNKKNKKVFFWKTTNTGEYIKTYEKKTSRIKKTPHVVFLTKNEFKKRVPAEMAPPFFRCCHPSFPYFPSFVPAPLSSSSLTKFVPSFPIKESKEGGREGLEKRAKTEHMASRYK